MTREQDTAKKIVDALNYGAADLDRQTAEQLAAARHKAIEAAQPAYAHHTSLAGFGHSIQEYFHGHHGWRSIALVASVAVLVFVGLQNNYSEPVEADTMLLASDLPPEAYVDKGFDAWLANTSQN